MIGMDWIAGLPTTEGWFDMTQNHVDLLSGKVHAVGAMAIIRDMYLRSGDGPTAFPACSWWITTPSSRAMCSWPSPRAVARASSSARRTTRTPTPRWNAPKASSATRWAPSPTAARTTGTATCRSPCSPSMTRRRRLAATRRPCSSTAARTLGSLFPRLATTTSPLSNRRRTMRSGCGRWRRQCGSCWWRCRRSGRRSSTRGPGRYGVQGGGPGAAADQGAARRRRYR